MLLADRFPNVILVHCHDLGDLIGCFPGNSADTPALNELAGQGMTLRNHFATAPQCSPSRASMMTGLFPHRNGLMGLQNRGAWNMDSRHVTIANLLRGLGYATASFGIWHINQDLRSSGVDEAAEECRHCEEATERALEFLRRRPRGQPFFLMVGFFEPHRPWLKVWPRLQNPAKVALPSYLPDIPEAREEMSRFYGEVGRVDASVANIIGALDGMGLGEDTLFIFTTDHGIAMPYAKGTLYDPGLKIACLLRWPGRLPAGSRFEGLTSNVDLLPTIMAAVGRAEAIPAGLDGVDLWPSLTRGTPLRREHVFGEMTWHDFYEPMRCIRTREHKLIRNFDRSEGLQLARDIMQSPIVPLMREQLRSHPRPEYELYNLAPDPVERVNLAGNPAYGAIESRLKRRLNDWLETTQDPVLRGRVEPPPTYFPVMDTDWTRRVP